MAKVEQMEDEIKHSIIELNPNIFSISIDYGFRPNIGVFKGEKTNLIIDTGHKRVVNRLIHILEDMDCVPVHYLINTHYHHDHSGANDAILPEPIEIGNVNLEELHKSGILSKNFNLTEKKEISR